mgnify:CR=1 FL=1
MKFFQCRSVVLVIFLAVVVALTLPPIYRSSAIVLVEAQEIPADFVMTTVTSYVEQRVQNIGLKTRDVLNLVADRGAGLPDLKDREVSPEVRAMLDSLGIYQGQITRERHGRPSTPLASPISCRKLTSETTCFRPPRVLKLTR